MEKRKKDPGEDGGGRRRIGKGEVKAKGVEKGAGRGRGQNRADSGTKLGKRSWKVGNSGEE